MSDGTLAEGGAAPKHLSWPDYRALVGEVIAVSDWVLVPQTMIDAFADLTDDHQFIHVDPLRAAATPFCGTIAHGLLTLALLGGIGANTLPAIEGAQMTVNYGFDRVRFVAPVPSGARIRAQFRLAGYEPKGASRIITRTDVRVEIEGADTPALIAEWLVLTVFPPGFDVD